MNNLFNSYKYGYISGYKDAVNDLKTNSIKKTKKINDKELKSLLYDYGYINGYNKNLKKSLNFKKNII